MSESAQVTINGAIFSRYECQVSCAIKLWIKDSNNATPSDDNLGYIVKFLRGTDDETVLPCQNIVAQIRRHSEEGVRSIYESVYVNKSHWEREASRVYIGLGFLMQKHNIAKRSVSELCTWLCGGVLKTDSVRQIR